MNVGHDNASQPTSSQSAIPAIEELHRHKDWFVDPLRLQEDNVGPRVVVIDNFYPDPEQIRTLALQKRFERFSPPLAEQVGEEIARPYQDKPGLWLSTAVVVFGGKPVKKPFIGERYNPASLRERLSEVVNKGIDDSTWDHGGDYWNGAFHLLDAQFKVGRGSIHHHYKSGDVEPRGWSGVVYLSPDAPPSAGTSIWRERTTGLCVAAYGAKFDHRAENFEQALLVENRFNRLVLFRENVLHRPEHGFGSHKQARLTQTFFFRTV